MFNWVLNTPLLPAKVKETNDLKKLKTLWPLFMNGVQLSQDYRAITRRQFTFYHSVPRCAWYPYKRYVKCKCPVFINIKQVLHYKEAIE